MAATKALSSSASVDIRNFTRRSAPGLPYKKIAQAILPQWDISLVFSGSVRAKNLNILLRGKDYIPNVLSYELSSHRGETSMRSGEIVICLPVAKQQAQSYGLSYRHFTAFLFIHGLLHLEGLRHGPTMERHEYALLKRFTGATPRPTNPVTYGTTNRNRH
jgi:rRNA maturation RNase YbeY